MRHLEAVQLCERAYDRDDDIVAQMRHFANATHMLLIDAQCKLVSYALWIERWLTHGSVQLRSAYVELVATDPDRQRQGHASTVIRALGSAIVSFSIVAVGLGLLRPLGMGELARLALEQPPDGQITPSFPEEVVMILRQPNGPEIDLAGPLLALWRSGEIW